jgi:predicted DNA-binding protein
MSKLPEVLPQARVSERTLSWLKAKAKEQDRSLAYVIREALDQYIERNSTKGDQ